MAFPVLKGAQADKLCLGFLPGQPPRPPAPGEASRRIYAGTEFCERLLPDDAELDRLIALAEKEKLSITLLTPFVTEAGLERLSVIFGRLAGSGLPGTEVSVNDWGVLRLLKGFPGLGALLGRELVSRYLRVGEFPVDFLDMAFSFGVRAFEFNIGRHLVQAAGQLRARGAVAHLYMPCRFMSVTRFCRMPSAGGGYYRDSLGGCARECLDIYGRMEHRSFGEDLLVWSNAVMFKGLPVVPEEADRIVLFDFEGAI